MRTWIFQGNPDEYDIDSYLASRPPQLTWLVTRYAAEIGVGDRVYLWRNQGKQKAIAGVIAEAIVTKAPELRDEDADGAPFWRAKGPRVTSPQVRAVMRLIKVATSGVVLRREWCDSDPVLRELPNLKMQAGTNYLVTPEQANRLGAIWSRTGRDWARNELIAALMVYTKTFGQPISRLPGSLVAGVALMTGRSVSSAYAKVMNFRHLDPRAIGGMSGAGEKDGEIWREYYDDVSATILVNPLSREYARLWDDDQASDETAAPPEIKATTQNVGDEAERLEELSYTELLAKYESLVSGQSARPATRVLSARVFERNPLIIAIARLRSSRQCEVPNCASPPFNTAMGRYVEVHHIVPLSEGGDDTIANVACLCASHHREIHLGVRASELTAQLQSIRAQEAAMPGGP